MSGPAARAACDARRGSRPLCPLQCPVYDLDNNVAFIGMYQTMTKKAAITVQVGVGPCHGAALLPAPAWRWRGQQGSLCPGVPPGSPG